MIDAASLKPGVGFLLNGKPHQVLKYEHQKIGRGGAKIKVLARNLTTGESSEHTFNNGHKFEEIATSKKKMQFLFSDGGVATFMDSVNYSQVEIPVELIKNELLYLNEGEDVNVLFWDSSGEEASKPLSVDIPPKVELEVVETDPGVKGNSASNVYKNAKLSNGLETRVPLFIKTGDKVRVDTRSGEYVERVSQ